MMKSFITLATLSALLPYAFGLMVNTPASLVYCQPVQITYGDGTPPYWLSVIPGGQPNAAALKQFDQTDATQVTWRVDIPAGTSVTLSIRDNTGAVQYSDQVTIQAGSGTCESAAASGATETGSAQSTPTGGSSAPAVTGAASGSPPAASPAPSATQTPAGASTKSNGSSSVKPSASASSSAPPSSQNNNSAAGLAPKALGVAGVLGLMGFMAI